jgi:hypothetical protein
LYSDPDILLPFAGAAELLCVAAFAVGIGCEAVTKRIREQLNGSDHFEQSGLTLSTSYRPLQAIKRNADESMEGYLEKVTTKIQELMKAEISSRMVKNGQ